MADKIKIVGAKEHNLNWKEFFTIDELKDWLENG